MKKFRGGIVMIKGQTAQILNELSEKTNIEDINFLIERMHEMSQGQKIHIGSYEKAANLLLESIESGQRDFVNDVAKNVLGVPNWQVIMGAVLLLMDQGMLANVVIWPDWGKTGHISLDTATCRNCGLDYKPKRQGQIYCCNGCAAVKPERRHHSDDCPLKGVLERISGEAKEEQPAVVEADNIIEKAQIALKRELEEPSLEPVTNTEDTMPKAQNDPEKKVEFEKVKTNQSFTLPKGEGESKRVESIKSRINLRSRETFVPSEK